MKKISLILTALAIMSLSSCYVEERGGYRYHHPFWHHREVVEIRGDNNIKIDQQNMTSFPVDTYSAKK